MNLAGMFFYSFFLGRGVGENLILSRGFLS